MCLAIPIPIAICVPYTFRTTGPLAGCIVSGQADNVEFEISVSAETAEEGKEKSIRFLNSDEYEKR